VSPRFARVDGVDIAYYVRGSGPPALFVMGLGGRAADWGDRFLDAMAAHLEVLTVDNRGTGASARPGTDWTLETMADEAVGVLDALGRPRAHVVGLSMGGMLAQLIALRHPARVDRLALVSSHGGGPGVVPPTPAAMAVLVADRSVPRAEVTRRAMATISAPGFAARHPEAIEALVALAEAQPTPEVMFARQLAAILASDRMADLPRITAPTLVVHGTEDPLVPPANGVALARAIPGARLVELPGCGHLPMWECPDRLATILLEELAPSTG
jgi:pimeloyl-ACP methyl ester carboxylesterase